MNVYIGNLLYGTPKKYCKILQNKSSGKLTGALHFCLVLVVPFSRPRNIFLLSSKLPLTLCACHCINSIFKSLCTFLQCLLLQCLFLGNKIRTFPNIDYVQYTFQLKYFERNNVTPFQVFIRKSEKLRVGGRGGGPNWSGGRGRGFAGNFFEKK